MTVCSFNPVFCQFEHELNTNRLSNQLLLPCDVVLLFLISSTSLKQFFPPVPPSTADIQMSPYPRAHFISGAASYITTKKGRFHCPLSCLHLSENSNPGILSGACSWKYDADDELPSPLSVLPFHGSDRTFLQSPPGSSPGMLFRKNT